MFSIIFKTKVSLGFSWVLVTKVLSNESNVNRSNLNITLGCYISPPLMRNIILSVYFFPWNRSRYTCCIKLSSSHVASSRLNCLHCTLTWVIAHLCNVVSLFSRIRRGFNRNSPFDLTFQTTVILSLVLFSPKTEHIYL